MGLFILLSMKFLMDQRAVRRVQLRKFRPPCVTGRRGLSTVFQRVLLNPWRRVGLTVGRLRHRHGNCIGTIVSGTKEALANSHGTGNFTSARTHGLRPSVFWKAVVVSCDHENCGAC
jgi:hypothetical protein